MQRGMAGSLVASERTIQSAYDPRETSRDAKRAIRRHHEERPSSVRRRTASFETEALSTTACLAALGAATDGVLLINRAGVVVYCNPAAQAFFSEVRLSGQFFSDVCALDKRTLNGIWRELHRTSLWRGSLALRSTGPELEVTVQRVSDGAAGNEKFCVVLHGAGRAADSQSSSVVSATSSKRSRGIGGIGGIGAAGELQSALQRVASEIAHDFNNQIAVVLNYTFVLLRQMPAESPLKAHVSEMQAAAWRASQIAQAIHRSLMTHTLLPSGSE